MKKLFILFSTILLMISLGGCRMSIDRKAIAEKALQKQYGEEFVAYHTWDHGGDSFDVSLYPKSDESIKFNAVVKNDGRIVVDYYAEKIVGKEIIEIIKPYIDEIAEESAYFATVPIQDLGYTSKGEVSIEDFYTRGKTDESEWPFIHVCINSESILLNIDYETEYDILIEILRDIKFNVIGGMNLVLYFVNNNEYDLISQDFSNRSSMDSGFDQLSGSEQKIYITKGSGEEFYITRGRGFAEKQMSINEYIQNRKEIEENE